MASRMRTAAEVANNITNNYSDDQGDGDDSGKLAFGSDFDLHHNLHF